MAKRIELDDEEIDLLCDALDALEAMRREGSMMGSLVGALVGGRPKTPEAEAEMRFRLEEEKNRMKTEARALQHKTIPLRAKLLAAELVRA